MSFGEALCRELPRASLAGGCSARDHQHDQSGSPYGRDNVIRNLAGGSAPSNFAMLMSGCERLLIQKNILQSDSPTPLLHANMGTIQTFNNVTPDGDLIRSSVNGNIASKAPEVVAQIRANLEDAMVASLLGL